MKLEKLILRDFRNYSELTLSFAEGVTVFTGENAQGKTNLVEAVYLCCTGRSHRTAHDKELIRRGCEQAYVRCDAAHRDGMHRVELGLNASGRKSLRVNGLPARRLGELMGHVNAVIFSPEDLNMLRGGPGGRRRFMDMEISQSNAVYFYELQTYQRALLQRNALLKGLRLRERDADTLDVWDEQLARSGARIALRRREFFTRLEPLAVALHERIAKDSVLSLRYRGCVESDREDEAEAELLEKLRRSRDVDLRLLATQAGPHRDDIAFAIDGAELRAYGSQGQQRTVAIALKLAELAILEQSTGESPVLILDDVLSELDENRRRSLLCAVGDTQTLITCVRVEAELAALGVAAQTYQVHQGAVKKQ
ncbi:MAG: DNA replication/repair protein RecF [Eubacteriales bacterium]|nr:DNA replication/repair protein RecF [Eubacteriales bacterium]